MILQVEGRICIKERESVLLVQRGERGGKRIYLGADEEGIHKAIKITTNSTSVFVRKKDGKKRMVQDYQYLNE